MRSPKRKENVPWHDGEEACVFLTLKAEKDFRRLNMRAQAAIEATIIEQYCEFGPQDIPREKLNRNEGRHSVDGNQILVQVFKKYQARLYGVEGSLNGKRAFFATHALTKKKDGADVKELRKAAVLAVEFADSIVGAKVV